ncbi:MAG: hypothetical protein JNL96_28840 [Planctomycetaceae bacterium]|nr:hypothetical protein [Planctomycetaceae bacterium]
MTEAQGVELLAKLDQLVFVNQATLCACGFLFGLQLWWIIQRAVSSKSWWG